MTEAFEAVQIPAGPTEQQLLTPAETMLASAQALIIDSPEMEQVAADELAQIKRKYKDLEEERFGITRLLDESKRRIMDRYRRPLDYLTRAELAIKQSIGTYRQRLDDQRRERQRAADEAARKARERLEAEARAEREKAAREAAELQRKADEAAAAGRAQEAARLAARATSKVDAAESKSDSLLEAAAAVPTSVVLATQPKASGVHTVARYTARVVDKKAFVEFVVATPMFLNLLDVNQSAIDSQARALKDQFAIPGLELVKSSTVSARAA